MRLASVTGVAAAALLAGAAAAVAPGKGGVHHAAISLEPEGELLGAELVDLDGDGREEVCLAVRGPGGGRELQLYRLRSDGAVPAPFRIVPVLDDAVAYGFADVRAEDGRELLFLTRSGAWSYSLSREGFRGNIRRLVESELIYDVADPHELPAWRYVFPRGAGADWVLLPGRDGYSVWGPRQEAGAGDGSGGYVPLAEFRPGWSEGEEAPVVVEEEPDVEIRLDGNGLRVKSSPGSGHGPMLAESERRSDDLLSNARSYRAPALVDVDGDGHLDLVRLTEDSLHVHIGHPGGSGGLESRPDRSEELPAYLERDEVDLEFVDLDGDGDLDLLAQCSDEVDGLESTDISLLVLLNDGRRLLPDRPDQVLRFETNQLSTQVADVDGDGRLDLAARKFEIPSLLDTVTGLEFRLTQLLYRGEGGRRPFARKPVLKQTDAFDETDVMESVANRELAMDCDGDGIVDVVEVDLQGRVSIRRLLHEGSFLGGDSWRVEATPWQRFETLGSIDSIEVRDLNGDALGDVISRGSKALSIILSSRGPNRVEER